MCHSTITRIKQPALLVISLFFVDFYLFIFFLYGSLGVEITFFLLTGVGGEWRVGLCFG